MARKRRPPRPGALSEHAPLRILKKMIVLQAAYYVSAIILIVFTVLVAGKDVKLDLLFSWRTIRSDTTVGWMMAMLWVLNGLISVIFILLIVVRSKLVLDFTLTIHGIHLIATSFYSHSIPTSLFWWAAQALSAFLMTFLGVWSCQWRELKPMSFGFGSSANGSTSQKRINKDLEEGTGLLGPEGAGSSGTYELSARDPNV